MRGTVGKIYICLWRWGRRGGYLALHVFSGICVDWVSSWWSAVYLVDVDGNIVWSLSIFIGVVLIGGQGGAVEV